MLYEFECSDCQHVFTLGFRVSDAPKIGAKSPRGCTACGSSNAHRVVSAVGSNREYQAGRDKYPYASRRYAHLDGATKRDANGHPIIESAAHEREVAARNGLFRE